MDVRPSTPTIDSATVVANPRRSARRPRRVRPGEISKKHEMAIWPIQRRARFETSTTISASVKHLPQTRSDPLVVSTPTVGEASKTRQSYGTGFLTSFSPMQPVPPMTTIFMSVPQKEVVSSC